MTHHLGVLSQVHHLSPRLRLLRRHESEAPHRRSSEGDSLVMIVMMIVIMIVTMIMIMIVIMIMILIMIMIVIHIHTF